ncbi:MAG: hypothetical protein HY565_00035 [Candidatus Kerfeldbacteria bacterium]|nr:hypothetical protein [Candidatus Kerfeldbacteria bacterium]
MSDQAKQAAQAAYQRYAQLVTQLGHEETQKLDQMIVNLEQKKITAIHQAIEQL